MPYELTPSDTTQTGLIWESSDPSIVSIDQTGLLTANAVGVATLTLTSASNPAISTTKRIEVFPSYQTLVRFHGGNGPYGHLSKEDGGEKAYSQNLLGASTQPSAFTMYDVNGTLLNGWSKMTEAEIISAFGALGGTSQAAPAYDAKNFAGSPLYENTPRFGEFGKEEYARIGINCPNGTYNVRILMSGEMNHPKTGVWLKVNGQPFNIPTSFVRNEKWESVENLVVSDGKIKIEGYCPKNNYLYVAGIMFEKIA
jgi:hypothetical protein